MPAPCHESSREDAANSFGMLGSRAFMLSARFTLQMEDSLQEPPRRSLLLRMMLVTALPQCNSVLDVLG